MPVQVGSAYGKIGLGVGDFTAGIGIVLASLDVLETRFKSTGVILDASFGAPLRDIPSNLTQLAQAGTQTGTAFEKSVGPLREYTTATVNLESKIETLSEKIGFQKRQLEVLDAELLKTLKNQKASEQQIERKQLAFDRLTASIKANERSLNGLQEELQESTKSASLFSRALDNLDDLSKRASKGMAGLDASVSSFIKGSLQVAAGNLLAEGLQAAAQGARDLGAAMIQGNEDFQVYQGQFSILLGSMDEANARLAELEEFGRTTPFELEEVVKASRQLEVLTKGALSTGEGLRFVGDVAAGVNEPLENVSMWIGRAYDAMQAGRPFGEAAMRLQEMGALSGEARNRLEDLQKQGADGSVIWKVFTEDLGRFDGQMDVLSGTFQGVKSNLQDTFNKTLRIAGKESFEVLEDAAIRALASIDENQEGIIAFATELGESLAEATAAGIQLAETVNWKLLGELITSAAEKAGDLAGFLADAASLLAKFGETDAGNAAEQLYAMSEATYAGIKRLHELGSSADAARAAGYLLTGQLEAAYDVIAANPVALIAYNEELIKTGHAVGSIPTDQFVEGMEEANETVQDVIPPLISLEDHLARVWSRVQEMANADSALDAVFAPETLGRFAEQLEKRADAAEKYGEKSREIAGKIVQAERDYAKEVNANLDELREARDDYNANVAEKGRELTENLKRLDKDYTATLKELYAERKALDEEYNANRIELSEEAAREQAANENEFNNEVEAIRADRAAAEAELQAGLLDAEREFQAERIDMEREHAQEVSDLTRDLERTHSDYTRERGYRHQDHLDKMGDLEEKHGDKVKDILKGIEDAEKDLADTRRDVNKDLQKDLDDLEEDRTKELGNLQKEIDKILARAGGIGVELLKQGKLAGGVKGLSGLDKDEKEELQALLDQLAEEKKAYDDQAQELRDDAQEKLDEEQEQHDQKVAALQERLDEEQALYDDAVAKEEERFRREEESKDIAYERAVEKLEERLTRENEAYDRQLLEVQAKHQAELDDLNIKYAQANEALNVRFTAALAAHDGQRAAIAGKLNDELNDLQLSHDAAVGQLVTRFTQELEAYNEKRGALITKNGEELEDLRASYADRVTVVGEKLDEMQEKHRASQEGLKDQIRETKDVYAEQLQAITDEFTKPADAMQRIEESLGRIRTATQEPFNIKFAVTGLPEAFIPESPSPFEQSLTRTIRLMEGVSRTPLAFDIQTRGGAPGTAEAIRKGAVDSAVLPQINSPLLNIEQVNLGDLDAIRSFGKRMGEEVQKQIDEYMEGIIERTYGAEAAGFAEVPGNRV